MGKVGSASDNASEEGSQRTLHALVTATVAPTRRPGRRRGCPGQLPVGAFGRRVMAIRSGLAITRRTARFAELPSETEVVLASRGLEVPIDFVDAAINESAERVAQPMGIGARASLTFAPDTLPTTLADALEVVATPIGYRAEVVDLGSRRNSR